MSRMEEWERKKVAGMLELDQDPRQIAAKLGRSPAQIYRMRSRLRLFGNVAPASPKVNGRPRALTPELEEVGC